MRRKKKEKDKCSCSDCQNKTNRTSCLEKEENEKVSVSREGKKLNLDEKRSEDQLGLRRRGSVMLRSVWIELEEKERKREREREEK